MTERLDTVFKKRNRNTPHRILLRLADTLATRNAESKFHKRTIPDPKLSGDYGQMLENGSFSDVTLTVDTKSFRAHKVVLAARSPVFAAMFQHDMLENFENNVTITDVDPKVFQEALRFIYTGTVSNRGVSDTMALELLPVAEKYSLDHLKVLCVESLEQTLSTETAAEVLIVADLCNAENLKAQAVRFIMDNPAKVMVTSGWFKVMSCPRILALFKTDGKE